MRSAIEAMARREPLVLAFEDIHWADDGHARPDRVPRAVGAGSADDRLPRSRRVARTTRGVGRDAPQRHLDLPRAAHQRRDPRSSSPRYSRPTTVDADALQVVAERAGGNPLFAEEMVLRLGEEGAGAAAELPDTVQALLAARLDSLEPFERRLMQQAAVVGPNLLAGRARASRPCRGPRPPDRRSSRSRTRTCRPRGRRGPRGRAGACLQARPDPRRRLRDAAQGGPLPEALRGRRLHRGARGRPHRGGRGAARRALRPRGRARRRGGGRADELEPMHRRRSTSSRPPATRAALLYSNREALAHYQPARELLGWDDPRDARPHRREAGRRVRCASAAWTAAVEVWEECLDYHRRQEDLERVGDLHRKIGAGLWHKGEREAGDRPLPEGDQPP